MEAMIDGDGPFDSELTPKPVTIESVELASIHNGIVEDYELSSPNSLRAIKEAEEYDLFVVFPGECELQIDIDSDHAFAIYKAMSPIVDKYFGIKSEKVAPSRSGLPKRHVTLELYHKLTSYQRIAIQLALGSDRVREMLSIVQEFRKDPHPTLFLEKKED
jgi:hypothetical protein